MSQVAMVGLMILGFIAIPLKYFELTDTKRPGTLIQWSALAQVGSPCTVIGGKFESRLSDTYNDLNDQDKQ